MDKSYNLVLEFINELLVSVNMKPITKLTDFVEVPEVVILNTCWCDVMKKRLRGLTDEFGIELYYGTVDIDGQMKILDFLTSLVLNVNHQLVKEPKFLTGNGALYRRNVYTIKSKNESFIRS